MEDQLQENNNRIISHLEKPESTGRIIFFYSSSAVVPGSGLAAQKGKRDHEQLSLSLCYLIPSYVNTILPALLRDKLEHV